MNGLNNKITEVITDMPEMLCVLVYGKSILIGCLSCHSWQQHWNAVTTVTLCVWLLLLLLLLSSGYVISNSICLERWNAILYSLCTNFLNTPVLKGSLFIYLFILYSYPNCEMTIHKTEGYLKFPHKGSFFQGQCFASAEVHSQHR